MEADTDYQPYRGIEVTKLAGDLEMDLERLERDGYFVVEGAIPTTDLPEIRERMDRVWELQLERFGGELLSRVGDLGVARAMMVDDPFFFGFVVHLRILAYVDATLGPTSILHLQNGIFLQPGVKHNQGKFHKDFAKDFLSSKLLSLNSLIAIDAFNAETGGTWVVPGSHRFEAMPSAAYVSSHAIQLEAPAGSAVIFDSQLWHRGGSNSSPKVRRAINQQYTRPFIKQQLDYPAMLSGRLALESPLSQRMGLWTVPPKSVEEYRVADPARRTYRAGQG